MTEKMKFCGWICDRFLSRALLFGNRVDHLYMEVSIRLRNIA